MAYATVRQDRTFRVVSTNSVLFRRGHYLVVQSVYMRKLMRRQSKQMDRFTVAMYLRNDDSPTHHLWSNRGNCHTKNLGSVLGYVKIFEIPPIL